MGLLNKEVEITLCSKTIKWYEDLGYEIPRKSEYYGVVVKEGTKMFVNVKDLQPYSKVRVLVECDCCMNKYYLPYYQYTMTNHNGLIYCKNCASTMMNSGDKHWHWDINKTDEERINNRNIDGYFEFIKTVLNRDKYKCQCCGENTNLEVHHLDGYNWCIEKRISVSNGITLCTNCHSNFHSIYGYGNNTKKQFEEWIGYIINDSLLENYNALPKTKRVYCVEENKVYDSAYQMAKEWDIWFSIIYQACNYASAYLKNEKYPYCVKSVKGKHVLWYDDYQKTTSIDIQNFVNNNQPSKMAVIKVICLTTKEIFYSITLASKITGVPRIGIMDCCNNIKQQHKSHNGKITKWMYYDDYLKQNNLTDEEARKSFTFIE